MSTSLSRVEKILETTLGYKNDLPIPQSRVEELLIELKDAIEAGGGGGGEITQLAARIAAAEKALEEVQIVNEAQNKAIDAVDEDLKEATADIYSDLDNNFVQKTDYAGIGKTGVVGVASGGGITMNSAYELRIDPATNNQIETSNGAYSPITAGNASVLMSGYGIQNKNTIPTMQQDIDRLKYFHKDTKHYGFKIDKNDAEPSTRVHYMYDAVGMTPAKMNYSTDSFDYGSWKDAWFIKDAYPVALKFDGTEDYKLNPDDYSKKLGSDEPSNIDSVDYDGNFMMAFPTVWFKRYEDDQYNYVEISNHKLDDDYHAFAHVNVKGEVCDKIYLPLFKGFVDSSNKLRSIAGVTPSGNTTATVELNAATACGKGWQFWDHSSRETICDLLTLIGCSTNSQLIFGNGQQAGYNAEDTTTYGKNPSGNLSNKGMFHGTNNTTDGVKVFGIEEFWGNRYDRILGMLLINGVWTIKMTSESQDGTDSLGYNLTGSGYDALDEEAFPCPDTGGYLKNVTTSKYGSIPKEIGAAASTYFCDVFYVTKSSTRVALVGGNCNNGARCGFRYVTVDSAASSSSWGVGASPIYKPFL